MALPQVERLKQLLPPRREAESQLTETEYKAFTELQRKLNELIEATNTVSAVVEDLTHA